MKIDFFTFRLALTLGPVENNKLQSVVRYQVADKETLRIERGVYAIKDESIMNEAHVLYIGKFEQTFSKRWLYSAFGYLFHHKKDLIRSELKAEKSLSVYVQDEATLRQQLGLNSQWVDINSIEAELIRRLRPMWNCLGKKRPS